MTPIEITMREWLASGDPAKMRHAKARIAMGFEPESPAATAEPPPLPSLYKQAVNLLTAGAQHVAAGMPGWSENLKNARLKICMSGCDNYRHVDKRCGGMTGCGCYLEKKAGYPSMPCPLGKWPAAAE